MPFTIGITGHKGLLGRYFLEHDGAVPIEADITEYNTLARAIDKIEPDAIVHCAAWTEVDKCEILPAKAHRINVDGTANVCRASRGVPVALISTDYVFDGRNGPYREKDGRSPLSVYGHTKRLAEDLMRPQDLICRTTILYGEHPDKFNFAKWVIRELQSNRVISVPWDQWGNPTYAGNLAAMIRALVRARYIGVWHTAGAACVNRLAFARMVATIFRCNPQLILPVRTEELNQWAERPKHGGFVVTKFQSAFPALSCQTPLEGLLQMRHYGEDRF